MYVVNIEVSSFNSLVETTMLRDLLSLSVAAKEVGDTIALYSKGYLPNADQLRALDIGVTSEEPQLTVFYQTSKEENPSRTNTELIVRKCYDAEYPKPNIDTGEKALPHLDPLGSPWNYDPMKRPMPVNRPGLPFDGGWVKRNFG